MYNTIKIILRILRLPKVPKHSKEMVDDLAKRAAIRSSQGNILIQKGLFVTSNDIQKFKQSLVKGT